VPTPESLSNPSRSLPEKGGGFSNEDKVVFRDQNWAAEKKEKKRLVMMMVISHLDHRGAMNT